MDISVNSTLSSSSSSYSNSSSNSTTHRMPPYHAALHSVRKLPGGRAGIIKKPISPMPPAPPKIYEVNPVDFRDVVQRLTGALEFQAMPSSRLREVAPPPLSLAPPQHRATTVLEEMERKSTPSSTALDGNRGGGLSPLGFTLSPSSMAWCSSILLSPGRLPF